MCDLIFTFGKKRFKISDIWENSHTNLVLFLLFVFLSFYSTERIDHVDQLVAEQHDDGERQGAAHHLQGGGSTAAEGDLVQGR